MLHKETVETGTLDLIHRLMADPQLQDFFLVGGTALSLLIGHRISIDIDLFTQKAFDAPGLKQYLEQTYQMTDGKAIRNGVFGFINNVKIDLIAHQYPLLKPLQEIEEGIRILSMEDIGAMKLHAIVNNGSRYKDFVDVFFLLEHLSLKFLAAGYEQKYPNVNIEMATRALLHFGDIDYSVPIKILNPHVDRKIVEDRLKRAIVHRLSLFDKYTGKQTHRLKRKGPRF